MSPIRLFSLMWAASGRCCGIDCEMSLDLNAVSRIPAMNQQRTESTPT